MKDWGGGGGRERRRRRRRLRFGFSQCRGFERETEREGETREEKNVSSISSPSTIQFYPAPRTQPHIFFNFTCYREKYNKSRELQKGRMEERKKERKKEG
jgi:hypothetical protein